MIAKRSATIGVFLLSLIAMLGSLYYSEIVGLVPCLLCWYQRILMYPIVVLSLVAIIRKSNELPYFVLPLSITGMAIALYHYGLQKLQPLQDIATPCQASGVSCTEIYLEYFGFVTIPLMSFAAFAGITILLFLALRSQK